MPVDFAVYLHDKAVIPMVQTVTLALPIRTYLITVCHGGYSLVGLPVCCCVHAGSMCMACASHAAVPACLLALLCRMACALQFRAVRRESPTTRPPRVRNCTYAVQIRTGGRLPRCATVLRKGAKVRRRVSPQRCSVAPLWTSRPGGAAARRRCNGRARASEQTPCRPAGPPAYVVARSVPLQALCLPAGPRLAGLQSPCRRASPPRAQVHSPRGRFTIEPAHRRGRTSRPTGGGCHPGGVYLPTAYYVV